jgi:16S rRNA (guanine527-N7)-methyltransferase
MLLVLRENRVTTYEACLADAASALQVTLGPPQLQQLTQFLALLLQENAKHNLVARADVATLLARHFFDSLSILPHLDGAELLDLGTGAGFPGMVLAIAAPQKRWWLVDSNLKKMRFLQLVQDTLNLQNVTLLRARAETLSLQVDCVLSRAVCDLAQFVQWGAPLCRRHGVLAAMKGKHTTILAEPVPPPYYIANLLRLHVPALIGERHLVLIKQQQELQ